MGLSVSAIRPYSSVSYTQKVDNAYALENQSEISDSYLDAVKNMNSLADIDPSTPVQYANAQRVSNKAVAPLIRLPQVSVQAGLSMILQRALAVQQLPTDRT